MFLAIGTSIVWLNVYYSLMNNNVKKYITILVWVFCCISIANYYIFGRNLGLISNYLVYSNDPQFGIKEYIINFIVIIAITIVAWFLYFKRKKAVLAIETILVITFITVSSINMYSINNLSEQKVESLKHQIHNKTEIPLSKNNKMLL